MLVRFFIYFRYMHVQIRLPTHNIVLWSVPPTYEWGQGHNIELIRLVLEPSFLDPSRCQLLYYKLDRRPGNKANGATLVMRSSALGSI